MNKRNTGENLNKGRNTSKITKGTRGIVEGTEKRAIGALENSKNLIQYTFPFVSGISQLGDTEKNDIQEQPGDTTVKARIYCIRHGMSVQEKEGTKLQTADTPLCKDAIDQYKKTTEGLRKLGVRPENTYLLYCEETEEGKMIRILESAELIAQGIGIPPERILDTISGLDTTDKDDDIFHRRISLTKTVSIDFAAQLLEKLGGNTISGINIICIIHKSNIEGIQEGIFQNKEDAESHLPKMDEIGTGDMTFIDVDIAGRPLNYRKRFDILRLDEKNYKSILGILNGEEKPRNIFTLFNTQKIQIWELQNYVNAYFQKQPECFSRFLNDKNSPIHLRVFCLANLIIQQDYTTIENYYLSGECVHLSSEEKVILLKNTGKQEMMNIFKKLFVSRSKLWGDEEIKLFTDEKEKIFYSQLKQSRLAYITATGLQSNSLDPLIKTGRENAVIDRQLYYEEEDADTDPDIQTEQHEKKMIQRDFDPDMFLKGGKYSKFIIRAHVGEGKSIYLSELVKQFSLKQDKEVKFVIAKNLKEEEIVNLFSNTQAIVCIDALDEVNEAVRNRIKEEFINFEGRCIISTRHSESFQGDEKAWMLYFRPLNSGKYIDSRFGEDITKATKVKKWIEKHQLSNDVKGNPLLLNLVVLLASADKDDKKWMKKYKIPEFNKIKTKSDLYENVVKFILIKHARGISEENVLLVDPFLERNNLETWMINLGQYAYDISGELDDKEKELKNGTVPYFDKYLSFLAKRTKEDNYEFMHNSFYEFFLARHLANIQNSEGNKKIYEYRDKKMKGNWNDWRRFEPVILFYCELIRNKEGNILTEFLGAKGILNNDDRFSVNFFIGLTFLTQISKEKPYNSNLVKSREKYIQTILGWSLPKLLLGFEGIKNYINYVGYKDTQIGEAILKIIFSELNSPNKSILFDILLVEVYRLLSILHYPGAIKGMTKIAKILISRGRIEIMGYIYDVLMNIRTPESEIGIQEITELLQKKMKSITEKRRKEEKIAIMAQKKYSRGRNEQEFTSLNSTEEKHYDGDDDELDEKYNWSAFYERIASEEPEIFVEINTGGEASDNSSDYSNLSEGDIILEDIINNIDPLLDENYLVLDSLENIFTINQLQKYLDNTTELLNKKRFSNLTTIYKNIREFPFYIS